MDRLAVLERQMETMLQLTVVTCQLSTILAKSYTDLVEVLVPTNDDQTEAIRSTARLDQLQGALAVLQDRLNEFDAMLKTGRQPNLPPGGDAEDKR